MARRASLKWSATWGWWRRFKGRWPSVVTRWKEAVKLERLSRSRHVGNGTGLKHGDEGAQLLFVFFLRLRKNERTRCSVEKAIAAEGKRWVGVLIEKAWRLYLPMRHRTVPYQGKPKSVVAIEGSRAERRILARSGLARYSAPSVKEKAAVRLKTTWHKIHQQWVVLWMDNWYNLVWADELAA